MRQTISALLVYDKPATFGNLQRLLESRTVEVQIARSCGEALLRLWGEHPPHLVFTETQLLDGIWADVLSTTRRSCLAVNVIVVSRLADLNLYIEVLERGAFDFIVPPFEVSELDHILRCATDNVLTRRAIQQPTAPEGTSSLESVLQDDSGFLDDDFRAGSTL